MTSPEHPQLDAGRVLAVLERHRVEYVVIGGFAAQLHGARRPTYDVDVTPRTSDENLTRLAGALRELGARIRVDAVDGGLPFDVSGESLRGVKTLNLVTPLGEMDLTFEPDGIDGFEDLARSATRLQVGEVQVRVAALADIIRSKTAAGRNKDNEALPELRRLARAQASGSREVRSGPTGDPRAGPAARRLSSVDRGPRSDRER